MSSQSTMSFAKRLATDEAFQTRAAAAVEGRSGTEATDALIEFGASHGMEITATELIILQQVMTKGDELSDESLERVAGGGDELANIDLQNTLQRQQQTMQMMSNVSGTLHDSSMAIIRRLG
jgi:predicted ribosomally synthesized peptide with nif11-like leader